MSGKEMRVASRGGGDCCARLLFGLSGSPLKVAKREIERERGTGAGSKLGRRLAVLSCRRPNGKLKLTFHFCCHFF